MRSPAAVLPLVLAALVPAPACGPGTSAATPLVRERAAYELDCPDKDIRVEEQMGGVFKAVGCGRKAMYRAVCDALTCVVHGEDEPALPWRDRPDPGAPGR